MTNDQKAREFWIHQGLLGNKTGTRYPASVEETPVPDYEHVIQYSAYDSLTKQLEDIREQEAKCCPEDYSFVEVIEGLRKQLEDAKVREQKLVGNIEKLLASWMNGARADYVYEKFIKVLTAHRIEIERLKNSDA